MKKTLSFILAYVLAFACLAALGGCGKAAESKQAFIAAQNNYYSELLDTLAAPVADIDSSAINGASGNGFSGKASFSVEGLDWLRISTGGESSDGGKPLGFDVDFVSDGTAASGNIVLTLLGETLNALFSTEGGDIAVSLPDLLPRPLLVTADMLAGLNYRYNDYPDYDWELLYDDAGDPYYYYSDDDGNEYYSYPDDYDYSFDEDDLDLDDFDEDDLDGEGIYSFDEDDLDEDLDWEDEYEFFDSLDFDKSYVSLFARYADRFLGNVSDGCYSSGREKFRTADGLQELDSLTLDADGNELMDALAKTYAEIAEDPGLDEIYGEHADVMRKYFREATQGELPQEIKDYYKDFRLKWTRFTRDGATLGESFNVKLPENEYTLEAGLDGSAEKTFAFIKLTDVKQGADLLNAESTVGRDKGELDVTFNIDGSKYSFSVSGKTTEQDGAKVTDADVRIGFGGLSFDMFKLKSTVRACDENALDFDFELSTDLPALVFGDDTSFALKFSADIKRDADAAPEMIDVSDAYTQEEMESDAFGEELENALKDKYPRIYELIESRKAALEEAAPEK